MTRALSLRPAALQADLAAGRTTARAAIDTALARIAAAEPRLGAWVSVDAEGARAAADRQDADPAAAGPLRGLSVGVKDVIDVAGWPTRAGSETRRDAPPARADAAVVARLRAAGAIPVGKTTTTEFATMDPTATVNPWGDHHTPGGSSAGSGAAVGAGTISAALGTQTAGSLCRPAAYCGAAAIKPSHGLLPVDGLVPLAPSFDTIGVIARSVADCRIVFEAIGGPSGPAAAGPIRVGLPAGDFHAEAGPELRAELDAAAVALTDLGVEVVPIDPPFRREPIVADHRAIMAAEVFAAHGHLLRDRADALKPLIRAMMETGARLGAAEVAETRARLDAWRAAVWSALAGLDAVLTLPVPGPAPAGLATTGPAQWLIPWSALRGPLVVLPGALDRDGLPLATMLAAAPGRDGALVALAERVAPRLDRLPPDGPVTSSRA